MAAHNALLDLLRALHTMDSRIESIPHNKAGPDGHYELNLLLAELLRIAQAAGDDLRLASHDIRDRWMASSVTPNPAYRFVHQVIELILELADGFVADLEISKGDREKLLGLIRDNLDRKPGTLIDPLEAARAIVASERPG